MNWDYFDKFDAVTNKYVPHYGQGETKASQIATAVCKLVYKWYNDGDVYDNTHGLEGWCNNLSSYANWLAEYADVDDILGRIAGIHSGEEYEDYILAPLADRTLTEAFLAAYNVPAEGNIYDCDGEFIFVEPSDEDEEY